MFGLTGVGPSVFGLTCLRRSSAGAGHEAALRARRRRSWREARWREEAAALARGEAALGAKRRDAALRARRRRSCEAAAVAEGSGGAGQRRDGSEREAELRGGAGGMKQRGRWRGEWPRKVGWCGDPTTRCHGREKFRGHRADELSQAE